MRKRILSMALTLCMILSLLPAAALAGDESVTVSSLAGLQDALANPDVTEIIVSENINITENTELNGKGKTVRAKVTGVNEQGVVQTGSYYYVFTVASGADVSISNMTIMGGSFAAIQNSGRPPVCPAGGRFPGGNRRCKCDLFQLFRFG